MAREYRSVVEGARQSANQWLMDRSIGHAQHLRRFGSHEVNEVVGFLNRSVIPDLSADLRKRLEMLKARGMHVDFTAKRYQDMLASFDSMMKEGMRDAKNMLQADLIALGKQEAAFAGKLIGTPLPVEVSVNLPSAGMMRSIVTARPFEGKVLNGWFGELSKTTSAKVDQQLRIGMMRGDTTAQIVQRIRGKGRGLGQGGVLNQTRRGTEAVVRSATNHVATQSRQQTYAENPKLVKGWVFVATLDGRTTLECASNDGKKFEVGEGPMPPLHMGCRSADSPILASWRDIGIDIDEADDATRASLNGEVPEKTTYSDWLRAQGDTKEGRELQDQVLGKRRAAMFRAGDISIDRFTDDFGATINLDQLGDLEQKLLG